MTDRAIIVTGLVRKPEKFLAFLDHIDRNHRGQAKVVFSTWRSEYESTPEIFKNLKSRGVTVLLSQEPALRATGHLVHQVLSLRHALTHLQRDCFVMKTRTDFCSASSADEFFAQEPVPAAENAFGALKYRFRVFDSIPRHPFFINDILFSGMAGDLEKLWSPSVFALFSFANTNPEQMLHSDLFLKVFPQINTYFMCNLGLFPDNAKGIDQLRKFLAGDDFYAYCLAAFCHVLAACYRSWKPDPGIDYSGLSLDEFVLGASDIPGTTYRPVHGARFVSFLDWASPASLRRFRQTPFRDRVLGHLENFAAGRFETSEESVEVFRQKMLEFSRRFGRPSQAPVPFGRRSGALIHALRPRLSWSGEDEQSVALRKELEQMRENYKALHRRIYGSDV